MSSVIRLGVAIVLTDGQRLPVGELAFGQLTATGEAPSAFRYAPEWLNHAQAFAIDPESLPLREGDFPASHLAPPLAVFDDALPDDWGRRLLAQGRAIPRAERLPWRYLLEARDHTMGALVFSARDAKSPSSALPAAEATDLAALIEAAERFDNGQPVAADALRRLLAAGSSPGGARPKAIVRCEGTEWLAKFPSTLRDAGHDVPGLEYVCLTLADRAGLSVPAARLLELGGRHVLLTQRFDRLGENPGGRRHMISLKTLCRERGGLYCQSYDEPMAMVRKHSAAPAVDIELFFRQMCVNVAIGNTDDHLKNFALLRDVGGWRLSPAFDLVPDLGRNGEHVLAIGPSRQPPPRATLLAVGERWLGSRERAGRVIDQVAQAVSQFDAVAQASGVSERSRDFFGADMAQRVAQITR